MPSNGADGNSLPGTNRPWFSGKADSASRVLHESEGNKSPSVPSELTILIPCLNEAETVGTCILKAIGFLRRSGIAGEILVSDNGSRDGSTDIAVSLGARVIHVAQKGYGAALIEGLNQASGKFVIMGDADDSYDFSVLEPF